jgi:hypothetical protein
MILRGTPGLYVRRQFELLSRMLSKSCMHVDWKNVTRSHLNPSGTWPWISQTRSFLHTSAIPFTVEMDSEPLQKKKQPLSRQIITDSDCGINLKIQVSKLPPTTDYCLLPIAYRLSTIDY